MFIFKKLLKITGHILFVIIFIFFSTSYAKNLEKFDKGSSISDYFSGILLLNQNNYTEAQAYLKKLEGIESFHENFSSNYLYSLINSGNFNLAFKYSKRLEREKKDIFESDLVMGIHYLKNAKFDLSNKYFLKAKKREYRSILDNYIAKSLHFWANLKNYNLDEASISLSKLDTRFQNIKKIQNIFLYCFYNSKETEFLFDELISNENTDFSRYNYFYAKYLENINRKDKAEKIINFSIKENPRNLLLNQYRIDLKKSKKNLIFDCKNQSHVAAEILYISANALSSQSMYQLSNFYLNLSKYLNKDFHTFDTLLAENFFNIENFSKAKKIYKKIGNYGEAFRWYSNKQISRILIKEGKVEQSIKVFSDAFQELSDKGLYETFDYAEFLKNNKKFEESIKYYSNVLNVIKKDHPLYADVKDSRGVAYERIGNWKKAEKDLLDSLEVSPDQAYVINYLAYTWIEKGIKIEKSLKMLEKANKLKSNDPYIIDSLGWALFKLKRYKESKEYLQVALKLMPADPIVNDHFGDVLWKNGNKLQARYYWNYVLNLEKAEKELKDKIEKKLTKGL